LLRRRGKTKEPTDVLSCLQSTEEGFNKLEKPLTNSALITGASSGLGLEFSNQLAAKGFDLILVARREERLEMLADSLRVNHGTSVIVFPADLSKPDEINQVTALVEATTNISLLINNAGFGLMRRFIRAEPEKEYELSMLHMVAPVMLCRAALPMMVARNYGAIINVSSIAGIIPIRSVLYGTSKTFLINFSEALQEEVREHDIHIQALCPGFMLTEFHDTPAFSQFKRESIPRFLWMTPQSIVTKSLTSLKNDKVICIPGSFYALAGALARSYFTSGIIKSIARLILRRRK
jgi:short-subunit dehydrogenase